MKFQAKIPKTGLIQATLDDLKRSKFLCDEEHFLSRRDRGGDQVRNCLTLAGSRRAFYDEILPIHDINQRGMLRTISVKDQRQLRLFVEVDGIFFVVTIITSVTR